MIPYPERYEKLNAKQKQAVDTIYGPVLVIAGPGSGKTELLSMRVANILRETDAHPSNILCLTFTDKATKNMRERLTTIIGQDAYRVNIGTFHSFGAEILNRYQYRLSLAEELVPIDDIEVSRIIDELQTGLPWDNPWKGAHMLYDIQNAIGMLKRAGITPGEYREIIRTNRQILDILTEPILRSMDVIFSLGSKKEEKREKVSRFEEFSREVQTLLTPFPEKHGLHTGWKRIFLDSVMNTLERIEHETDTKPITAWKNTWLEKDLHDHWILKESQRIEKHTSLIDLYEGYEMRLHQDGFIDFSDMILTSIRLIETYPDIRANLAEQYQWIMVDEYQDTNDAQMRLLTSILSVDDESPNIFAVGDDDQSIFKFQGANTKNIREFHDRWESTELILLEENYRSHGEIIDSSRTVMVQSLYNIAQVFPDAEKKFHPIRGMGGNFYTYTFGSEVEEVAWIVADIERKMKGGILPREIAVITKKNTLLEAVAKVLLSHNIMVSLSKEEDIQSTESVTLISNILLYIASLSSNPRDDLLVGILSHPAWGIHRLVLWNLAKDIYHARKSDRKSWIEALRTHKDLSVRRIGSFLIELSLRSSGTRLEEMIDLITGANECRLITEYDEDPEIQQLHIPLGDTEEAFRSPIYEYFFGEKGISSPSRTAYHLSAIRTLVERIRTFRKRKGVITLSDFSEFMSLIEKYRIRLTFSEVIGNEKENVNLMTVHKAKGLEFEHVYVIGLTEGQYKRGKSTTNPLPKNLPLAPDADDDEDILRLVYTAMTRAKDDLTLTFSDKNFDGKLETPLSALSPLLDRFEKTEIPIEQAISVLEEAPRDLFAGPYIQEETSFLRDRIEKQFTMSATALQNFLDLSSGGPESFIANNILRFPQAKNLSATYGSAMHSALEDFFSEYKRSGLFQKNLLEERFLREFDGEGFTKGDIEAITSRGKEKLEKLYGEITGRAYGELQLEYDFRTIGGGVYLDDIQLTGKIDRIEVIGDGRIRVTDYKTGLGFESLTESGASYERVKKWKYRLQLVFYALLFSLSPRWGAFPVREFELFFIEEDPKKKSFFHIVEYIQHEEIERMKRLIRAVMTKIRTLDFPDIGAYSPDIQGIRAFEEDLIEGRI